MTVPTLRGTHEHFPPCRSIRRGCQALRSSSRSSLSKVLGCRYPCVPRSWQKKSCAAVASSRVLEPPSQRLFYHRSGGQVKRCFERLRVKMRVQARAASVKSRQGKAVPDSRCRHDASSKRHLGWAYDAKALICGKLSWRARSGCGTGVGLSTDTIRYGYIHK